MTEPTFTTQELNDLVKGGNDFAVQIATQLLAAEAEHQELAERHIDLDEKFLKFKKAIGELPDKWREDCCASIGMVKLAVELKADELQAIINGENHDYNQM